MFFAAWVGQSFFEATWQDAFRRHAAWLGLECHLYSRTLGDGRVFAFGWASAAEPDTAALVRDDGRCLVIIPLDTPTRAVAIRLAWNVTACGRRATARSG